MGIRLDQLHSEVFAKIGNDLAAREIAIRDYLDNRVAEINVVFGLPEASHVERDIEVNKRNLEKSGFIELNRNFVPFRTGEQSETGVWVSNLNTNESPFEPRTIDGQKRGISVGGHILNYSNGNIGQNIEKMMKLPIAPKLPVFFPEDNDMIMEFTPSKTVTHPMIVMDKTIGISIKKRITDENKILISRLIEGKNTTYYYMDADSKVFYLNNEGRSYRQNAPAVLLVEPYKKFTKSFGFTFTFDMTYDSNAVKKYVDPETSVLFEIKTPLGTNASKIDLRFGDSQVFLEDMTVKRNIIDEHGLEQIVSITQPMLVTYTIKSFMLNGIENQQLVKTLVSQAGFTKVVKKLVDGGETFTQITDEDITMFISSTKMYYCFPIRKYSLDENGNNVILTDEQVANDNTLMYQLDAEGNKLQLLFDEDYKLFLPFGSEMPATGTIQVTDNITNLVADRTVFSIETATVSYYRVDSCMFGQNSNDVTVLDANGVFTNTKNAATNDLEPNIFRPVSLAADGSLTAIMRGTLAGQKYSAGKAFFYHHKVGTKYYRTNNNAIYYLTNDGVVFFPAQDVQEIFSGVITRIENGEVVSDTLFFNANNLMFYYDDSNLRAYVEQESTHQIQLTDMNGYRVFTHITDKSTVYVDTDTRMLTIASDGTETEVSISYSDLVPVFETADVTEAVLNLILPIPFNFVQGNVVISRNGSSPLAKYSDYNAEAVLRLQKDLEFNEETKKGDVLYVKRVGKKDIILRLEKKGTGEVDKTGKYLNDIAGHWANDTGDIVMPEPLTGNHFNWTEGELLTPGKQLSPGDVVKGKNSRYYQYSGTSLKYEDMGANKAITYDALSVFWEDVTVYELEYERKGQNYKIISANEGDNIRFTIIRRVWQQHPVTGELSVIEKPAYSIEKTASNTGSNLFVLDDPNFLIDDNPNLKSYILMVEKIQYYSTYKSNRANNFLLVLTGIQTVSKNEDPAMIYGDEYFLSKFVLYLTSGSVTDKMILKRVQAPQAELKIDFNTIVPNQQVVVPFEIIKNKFDIVVPQVLAGCEYTWIMGEKLPVGKTLVTGDVIFDKTNTRFYKFIGATKTTMVGGKAVPVVRETLLNQTVNIQKEILRQFNKINVNPDPTLYWKDFNFLWAKEAEKLSKIDGLDVTYFVTDAATGEQVLNISDSKVKDYTDLALAKMIEAAEHILNDVLIDSFTTTDILTAVVKTEVKRILNTNLEQFVLKTVKVDTNGDPILDEDGNFTYNYSYTRNFMVATLYDVTTNKTNFITRTIAGVETPIAGKWTDITAPKVGYYRFGKTFTILHTKAKDQVVVRLLSTGAEVFTSKRVTSQGGEITFAIDFNIEETDGSEIPFEVIYEEINWIDGKDYIQENQKLTLSMIPSVNQNVIIRRNDEFAMIDIVVLERKDLVFVETWHEDVSETGFIFPNGNVQYQGDVCAGVKTVVFDHVFYDTIAGETSAIENGAKRYCQVYKKSDIVYNYYGGTDFEQATPSEIKFIDETFVEDQTIGRGWKLSKLNDTERAAIFKNADHNLYYSGEKLIQVRFRTRVVALNLFKNYFKGTSEYMSEGLRFQGKSPVTSRIVTHEIGQYTTMDGDGSKAGQPIVETIQVFVGGKLIISSNHNSLLYKEGKLFDDSLFTVEEKTPLSFNGYVHAIPVAIVNRRNQGVYHPEFNDNGTGFFINGIRVSEDKEDFADDITGFTLVDENRATLETSSVGRDRKAKFKVMSKWLFSNDYKAGGSMVSRTTYRPDGLLYDEINTRDIIDLRVDADDHRKRLEDLESNMDKSFKMVGDLTEETRVKFEQTNNYIATTANLLYKHIATTEAAVRKDMIAKDTELTQSLDLTNHHLADLSANVFTKNITTSLLIDTIYGVVTDLDTDAFDAWKTSGAGKTLKDKFGNPLQKPDKTYVNDMIKSFVENMEGSYTKIEFMKFLVTVLKSVTDKYLLDASALEMWIKRLSVKNLALDPTAEKNTAVYSRAEALELIYEGFTLASLARVLPPAGSDSVVNWAWKGVRYNGWLGSINLDLNRDFLENGRTPVATKNVLTNSLTKTYTDVLGNTLNAGFIAGPTVWGNVHEYHAIYTSWIFVTTPFKLENVMMNGDDPHAVYINRELIARNKYCCRDTAYSYDFAVPGWYRVDMMYSESQGGHYIQLGWNPLDYTGKIKYMTTTDMDGAVEITKMRLDNWASKLKSLTSTIPGDASGYFTKLETKLILINGLSKIRNHILTQGTAVSSDEFKLFHGTLDTWLNTAKFTDADVGGSDFIVQPETINGVTTPRVDKFRPDTSVSDLAGTYNKDEIYTIITASLKLVNGIDSMGGLDIENWVKRLNISIAMTTPMYLSQVNADKLLNKGINYLAGLDMASSFEIDKLMSDLIKKPEYVGSANTVGTYATKAAFKTALISSLKSILGAQAIKTRVV